MYSNLNECMYVCMCIRKNFNLIGCRKIEAVAGALALGYDVVFSDVDIALLKDPIGCILLPLSCMYVHIYV